MSKFVKSILPMTCLSLVAACGGSGGQSELDSFIERTTDAQARAETISEIPGTSWTAMPARGSAVFTGNAGLLIDPVFETDDDDIVVIGDASMTANFSAGTMTGSVTNMQGATNLTASGGDIVDVDGTIRVGRNLSIIGDDFDDNLTDRPNQWLADYSGDLSIEGDSYVVEGTLEGDFRGTRANPSAGQSVVRGITGVAEDGYAIVNGQHEEVPAVLEIFGTNR